MSGVVSNDGIELIEALKKGDEALVLRLLEGPANLNVTNSNEESALHVAAFNGDWKNIKRLSQRGAWVDVPGFGGKTPLHIAAANGELKIVRLLLECGAEVNAKARSDAHLVTPLLLAAEKSHFEIMKELINRNADVNDCDSSSDTPLHNVIRNGGNEKCVQLLIDSHADVNLTNLSRATPLLMACEMGQKPNVERLLRAGARTDIKDCSGKSPLDWAQEKGFTNIVELLEQCFNKNCISESHGARKRLEEKSPESSHKRQVLIKER